MLTKRHFGLFILLLLGFLWRIYLVPQTYSHDLVTQATWGEYVGKNGPQDLYDHNVWTFSWPNHPPLSMLLYGLTYNIYNQFYYFLPRTALFLINHTQLPTVLTSTYQAFTHSFNNIVSPQIPIPLGYLICLKLVTIFADLALAILIYFLAQKYSRRGLLYSAIYLFSPFSFYISGVWGQTDQLGYLFTLLGFLFIYFLPHLSLFLFWLGISLKPTALLLIPTYIFLNYKYKTLSKILFPGLIVITIFTYLYLHPFSQKPTIDYLFNKIIPTVFRRGEVRLTTNSFNFWHIFTIDKSVDQDTAYLLVPTKYYVYLLLLFVHLYAFKQFRLPNQETKSSSQFIHNTINILFITSAGIWLFSSNMLERYYFAGVLTGLLVCINRPKLLYLWVLISLLFWVNLTRGFWNPGILVYLKDLLEANQKYIGRPISVVNILLYFLFVKRLFARID